MFAHTNISDADIIIKKNVFSVSVFFYISGIIVELLHFKTRWYRDRVPKSTAMIGTDAARCCKVTLPSLSAYIIATFHMLSPAV